MLSPVRSILPNVVLLAAACLAALGLGEILVREWEPQEIAGDPETVQPRGFYAPRPPLAFAMNPEFRGRFRRREFDTQVEIGPLGIRDRDFGPRAPGVRRVVVLGDSYTFGWGVEVGERYVDRLEEDLAPRWEVIKAGVNAYGTREEGEWLRAIGWSLEPEIVVLQFCMGNDFADNVGPRRRAENGFLVTEDGGIDGDRAGLGRDNGGRGGGGAARAPSVLGPVKTWLRAHSQLYVFLSERARWFRLGITRSERAASVVRDFNGTVDAGLATTAALLGEIAADARAHGARFLVVIVPMRHQVYDYAAVDRGALDHPNRALAAACDSLGIAALDLLPAFREETARGGPRLYFRRDRHWTREGHALAARALHEDLIARGWLQ
jgi:lysophospholipase L1-like esterase